MTREGVALGGDAFLMESCVAAIAETVHNVLHGWPLGGVCRKASRKEGLARQGDALRQPHVRRLTFHLCLEPLSHLPIP
jgi:hypothetical protein